MGQRQSCRSSRVRRRWGPFAAVGGPLATGFGCRRTGLQTVLAASAAAQAPATSSPPTAGACVRMAAAGRPPDMRAAGYLEALVRGDGGQGPLARVLPATIRAGERVRRIGTLLRGGRRGVRAPVPPAVLCAGSSTAIGGTRSPYAAPPAARRRAPLSRRPTLAANSGRRCREAPDPRAGHATSPVFCHRPGRGTCCVVLLTVCRRQTPRLRPVSVRRGGRRSGCT